MKPLLENLKVSPFSDLKELVTRNRCKTKTKPHLCDHLPKHESGEVYNSGIIKKGLHPQCQAFL